MDKRYGRIVWNEKEKLECIKLWQRNIQKRKIRLKNWKKRNDIKQNKIWVDIKIDLLKIRFII